MTNLAHNLTEVAAACADRTALKLDELEFTYRALDAASACAADMLRSLGVRPGDRVGLMLPNVPYFAIAYYGILRAGGVVVPMNVLLKERETGFYLADSQAKAVFAWHEFARAAKTGADAAGAECILVEPGQFERLLAAYAPADHSVEPREAGDTAVILHTSGTTGQPKGAELTHGNLRANTEVATELLQLTGSGDVILGALPLFHSFGQTCGLNASIATGGCLTLIPRFDPGHALSIIERDAVTVFEGVPTMYSAMLNHRDRRYTDTSSLVVCASGGAALPVEVLKGFEAAFGCKVLEGYGLSETSPIEGVELKLIDKRDLIIRGGYNVYPRVIELPVEVAS